MKTSAVIPFDFKSNQVRAMTIDGEPWFVARDVCDILELEHITNALAGLDDDELTVEKLQSGGQEREMKLISESGLYTLIIRSNKPQAKPFRKWVTSEVLPTIRKTGGYTLPGAQPDQGPGAFKSFTYYGKPLTVYVDDEGAPWFRAADIARVLGYANINQAAFKLCDPRGRRKFTCKYRNGSTGAMVFVDEANLFRLLIRSSKTGTDALQRFFADTVLPAVRASLRAAAPSLPAPEQDDAYIEYLYKRALKDSRLLWWFDRDGKLTAKALDPDAYICPVYGIPGLLNNAQLTAREREALPMIIEAAAKRLSDKQ